MRYKNSLAKGYRYQYFPIIKNVNRLDAVVFAPLVYVHLSSFFHGVLPQLDGSCGNGRLRRAVCIALGRQGKAGDNLI